MTSQAKALTDLIALFRIQDAAVPAQIEHLAPDRPAAPPRAEPVLKKVAGSDVEWQEL